MRSSITAAVIAAALAGAALADDAEMDHHHDHPAPEHLGRVSFATSCAPAVEPRFNRAVALLHSFTYTLSRQAFAEVLAEDPDCAMAAWGESMTHFHQLWEPYVDSPAELAEATQEIGQAAQIGQRAHATPRERAFIEALGLYFSGAATIPHAVRAERYSEAMASVARDYPTDDEAQVFYALSLIAIGTADAADRTHADQKKAAAILERLWREEPGHPGIAHYLIHAYDSAELAPRGLAAARAYARIAPSAPHALHMPSHIFTRLGLWRDSVASNLAARAAAHAHGELGEELHAMDYLTYAYLQLGQTAEARKIADQAASLVGGNAKAFKSGYAGNAMPVRVAVETRDWPMAGRLTPLPNSAPETAAIVAWARALGHARRGQSADADIAALTACRAKVQGGGNPYWTSQTDVLLKSAQAWQLQDKGDRAGALVQLTAAADEEDALEKLPVTPGPIVPAREQLGELLLADHQAAQALRAFKTALADAPGRRGALKGAIAAAMQANRLGEAARFRRQLAHVS